MRHYRVAEKNLGHVVGPEGKPGKSAYQIWLDKGNTGTEEDFLNTLKGPPGASVEPGTFHIDENGNLIYTTPE